MDQYCESLHDLVEIKLIAVVEEVVRTTRSVAFTKITNLRHCAPCICGVDTVKTDGRAPLRCEGHEARLLERDTVRTRELAGLAKVVLKETCRLRWRRRRLRREHSLEIIACITHMR